jgi:hypothetical protein
MSIPAVTPEDVQNWFDTTHLVDNIFNAAYIDQAGSGGSPCLWDPNHARIFAVLLDCTAVVSRVS